MSWNGCLVEAILILEDSCGGYISNYAFKMLMLRFGFKAEDYTEVNWRFYAKYVESN